MVFPHPVVGLYCETEITPSAINLRIGPYRFERQPRVPLELAEERPDFLRPPAARLIAAIRIRGVGTNEGAKLQRIPCRTTG